ncbi:MAG: ABC transporter ATP-binding protein [Gammaproteobacteria bacterium]
MRLPRLLAGRQRLVLARLLANGVAQAACAIGLAWLIRTVVDHVLLGGARPELSRMVTEITGGFAVVSVLALLRRRERIDREILAQTHAHRLRRALYACLNATPAEELAGMRRGGILLRFLGDLTAITQWVGMGLARLGVASLTIVATLAVLAASSPLMVLAVSVVLVLGTGATFAMGRWMDGTVDRARNRRAIVANNITEKLSALLVVRAFGQAAREEKRLLKQSRSLRGALIDRSRAIGSINAIAEATGTLATLSALLVGILAVAGGQATPGDVVAMTTLTGMLAMPSRDLGKVYEYWRRAQASQRKLEGFLSGVRARNESNSPALGPGPGRLEFDSVGFPGVLADLTVAVEPGSRIAVSGAAGSGKSLLMQIAAGLTVPREGRVLLDGQDVATCTSDSLRAAVGVVSADLPLLRGTLDSNLRYAWPEAPASALERILPLSGVDTLVQQLPGGLDSRVAEGGRNLSAGQRQRVALARALLRQPRLLLLDDIDTASDADYRGLLRRLLADFPGTLILVTQDPVLLAAVDTQWRLQDGRLEVSQSWRRDGDRKIVSLQDSRSSP